MIIQKAATSSKDTKDKGEKDLQTSEVIPKGENLQADTEKKDRYTERTDIYTHTYIIIINYIVIIFIKMIHPYTNTTAQTLQTKKTLH